MKKKKAKVILISLLVLSTIIALLFGAYLISVALLFDDMKKRDYNEYAFDIPASDNTLLVKEWVAFKNSGDEFYLKNPDGTIKYIDQVFTDEESPFADNSYKFEWSGNSVTISYKFNRDVWKEITLSLS